MFDHFNRNRDFYSNREYDQPFFEYTLTKSKEGSKENEYPNYNYQKIDSKTDLITINTAGFSKEELDIDYVENKYIEIRGNKNNVTNNSEYVKRGIIVEDFVRNFKLRNNTKIGEVSYVDGILHIEVLLPAKATEKTKKINIK